MARPPPRSPSCFQVYAKGKQRMRTGVQRPQMAVSGLPTQHWSVWCRAETVRPSWWSATPPDLLWLFSGALLQMPPTPPVDPENVEFVIFVRSKKVRGGTCALPCEGSLLQRMTLTTS